MPTLLIKDGFRFYFYSREYEHKPAHVHVEYQAGTAVFWLDTVSLREQRCLKKGDLIKAEKIVLEYRDFFLRRYNEFFKRK